ncbi:hypothetical protein F5Y13DRAFT_204627 [Hypoxylon sp. FL1857]|nr:hypothetical protein F5Y13DRAFT_204627 [Hypoxylon sp. FL1857]
MSTSKGRTRVAYHGEKRQDQAMIGRASSSTAGEVTTTEGISPSVAEASASISHSMGATIPAGTENADTSPNKTSTMVPAQRLSPIKESGSESIGTDSEPSEGIASIVTFHVDSDIVVHVDTPDGKVMFKVSSGSMVCASSVWATQLYRTNAGRCDTDDWMVEINGDVDALTTVFNIVHFKFSKVPVSVTLDELYEISLVFSQYDCAHLAYPWANKWVGGLSELTTDPQLHHVCHKALLVAWVFGAVQLFRDMTDALIMSSELVDGQLANVDGMLLKEMVLPPAVFDIIADTRSKTIATILSAIEKPFKQITDPDAPKIPLCSASVPAVECDAMMIGSAMPQLMMAGFFPIPNASMFPHSIHAMRNELASINIISYKACDARPHMYGAHAKCNLGYEGAVARCLQSLPMPLRESHMVWLAEQAKKTGVSNGKMTEAYPHQRSTPPRPLHSPGATIDFTPRSRNSWT